MYVVSSGGTSSTSTSSGLNTPQTSSASISCMPLVDNQYQLLADSTGTMRLSDDGPLPSFPRSSSDSSGGTNIPGATETKTAHFRTPSLSFTPPPANNSKGLKSSPAISGAASGTNDRLGMSEIADALKGVENSNNSGPFLRAQSPAVSDSPSQRRVSRKRSSSCTNQSPHNVTDEELPTARFHASDFQQAFLGAKQVISELTNVLSSGPMHDDPDSVLKRLYEKAEQLARFNCPSTQIVGFVGDSGVGKSSLINSLLDYPTLARASSGGGACTYVATEYHYHNTNDFAIEVQWFSVDEIVAQLTEPLKCYRTYHRQITAIDSDGSSDLKEQADLALETFREMFRGRFENEQFFIQSSQETVIKTLRGWAGELIPFSTDHREVYASLEDCSTRLQQLTSARGSTQEPNKCRYIHKVKVFSKAYVLSNGLVLVDLPGLRDLNIARRNITERYLLECDGIFAVCTIDRPTTDASVKGVFDLAEKAKLSHVGIVCTKSDLIKPEEACKDWPTDITNKIQLLREAIASDKRDFDLAENDLKDYEEDELSEEEFKDFTELIKKSKQAKRRMDHHKFELKHYVITTRNAYVIKELSSAYQNKISENDLKIFCVGNDNYWKYRSAPKESALPFLQLSGIFTLRGHCISMVATQQLLSARKYINDDIPALLGDIDLWIQSGAGSVNAVRKKRVCETLNKVEARLKQGLTGDASKLNRIERSLTEVFREQIYLTRRTSDWSQAAVNASEVWSHTYAAITYKVFCQHFGDHCTPLVGRHNWNEEAINQMTRDLATPWQNLKCTIQSSVVRDINLVEVLIDAAIEYIDTELRDTQDLANTLCRAMRSRQRLIITDLERAYERFQRELAKLRTDALSGIHTSFIGQLMQESYNDCNAQYGDKSHRRRSKIMTDRLGDVMVFEQLQIRFKNQFMILAKDLQSGVEATTATHLFNIKRTLDIIRNENVALESESNPEFNGVVEGEVRVVRDEIHRLQGVVNSGVAAAA